ncbi:MAG: hypothetical protein HY901_00350 [Deltaproteobacteria bacterium]|nr:hypothetical protein [Deltaproteobacteria bacterium]
MRTDGGSSSFSQAWAFLSVVLFLAIELAIGAFVGPFVIGKYVSPMFHLQLQMLMHLGSFYVGGFLVGMLSPGVRLTEPAVGAFISVAVVWLISFFMPSWFYHFDFTRLLVGGGIAFALALAGAYSGEKLMGNVEADDPASSASARGRLRARMWNETDGLLAQHRERDRAG